MIVTVGDASPRQAQGHIGDSCVKWKHFLSDVSDVADQTGTVRGRIERVEMSLKPRFHMIVTVIVSICRQLIGNMSPMCRSWLPTVTIIWKQGFFSNECNAPYLFPLAECLTLIMTTKTFPVGINENKMRFDQSCNKTSLMSSTYFVPWKLVL